jgi:hypothetical protein
MIRLKTTFAVQNFSDLAEFKLFIAHDNAGAVVTHTPQRLEHNIEETLMVHWPCKINMAKVTWIDSMQMMIESCSAIDIYVRINLKYIKFNSERN